MRVKRQKRHRKVVRFYSTCFGFREPYKVLLDGTFVHHLLLHGLAPADSSLSHLLGSRSLLFTTRCVIGELRSLGESHAAALDAAKQLITARCEHEKRVSATACIESVIGEENAEHFFVATQDTDLRKKFREVPGVPIIFGLRNSLFIEQPSSQQREFIKSTEEKRLHMSGSEFQKIHKRALMGKKTAEGSDGDVEEQAARTVSNTARRMLGVAQKSKFKMKKAKRPNPLSCKKKKKPKPEVSLPEVQEVKAEGAAKRKRIRKRNRVSKDSKPGETET